MRTKVTRILVAVAMIPDTFVSGLKCYREPLWE